MSLVRSFEFHKEPKREIFTTRLSVKKILSSFRRSQNYVIIHAVFAMNVGLAYSGEVTISRNAFREDRD